MSLDVRLPLLLCKLRLPTVAANYRKFAQEAAQSGQPYEEYLSQRGAHLNHPD